MNFPDKKYQIVYADPPWDIGYVKGGLTAGSVKGGEKLPYKTMTDNKLYDLSVSEIVDVNAFLFLWVVDSKIPIALDLMKA